MVTNNSDFFSDLDNSESDDKQIRITQILMQYFKDADDVIKDDSDCNDLGIDYFVFKDGMSLNIDVKARDINNIYKDIALEIWSNREEKHIGWTLDNNKLTDYVLFLWNDDYLILPFRPLQRMFNKYYKHWLKNNTYKTATQITNNLYHSECMFVPIDDVNNYIVWEQLSNNTNNTFLN